MEKQLQMEQHKPMEKQQQMEQQNGMEKLKVNGERNGNGNTRLANLQVASMEDDICLLFWIS